MTAGTGALPSLSSELRYGMCPAAAGGTKLLTFAMAKPQFWGGLWGHPRMMLLTTCAELFIPTTANAAAGTQCAGHHRDVVAQLGPTLAFWGTTSTPLSLECPLEESGC